MSENGQRRRINLWYWSGYYLAALLSRIFFRFRVLHRERRILRGPVILAMNHQSYLDPPLAGISSGRETFFLARKTLLNAPVLGWLLPHLNVVPVDQEGTDRSALKALIRILKAGDATVVFPEGARTIDGELQAALPGLGFVIAKTLAPVVPMRIFGAHEALRRTSISLRSHHHRHRRADSFHRRRSAAAQQRTLSAVERASHARDRRPAARVVASKKLPLIFGA